MATNTTQTYAQIPPCIDSHGHRFTVNYPPAGMFGPVITICERCGRRALHPVTETTESEKNDE